MPWFDLAYSTQWPIELQYSSDTGLPQVPSAHSVLPSLTISLCPSTVTASEYSPFAARSPDFTAALATTSASCAHESLSLFPLTAPSRLATFRAANSPGLLSFLAPTSSPGFKITVCVKPIPLTASSSSPFIFEYGIMDVGEAPEVEMRTYIVAPASLAALASATFKSKSILR